MPTPKSTHAVLDRTALFVEVAAVVVQLEERQLLRVRDGEVRHPLPDGPNCSRGRLVMRESSTRSGRLWSQLPALEQRVDQRFFARRSNGRWCRPPTPARSATDGTACRESRARRTARAPPEDRLGLVGSAVGHGLNEYSFIAMVSSVVCLAAGHGFERSATTSCASWSMHGSNRRAKRPERGADGVSAPGYDRGPRAKRRQPCGDSASAPGCDRGPAREAATTVQR